MNTPTVIASIAGFLLGWFVLQPLLKWLLRWVTPLGLLNFLVLQWFGARLARRFRVEQYDVRPTYVTMLPSGEFSLGGSARTRRVRDGWTLLRWVWPLTGWFSDYRRIARRG